MFTFTVGTFICSFVTYMKIIEFSNIECRRHPNLLRKIEPIYIIKNLVQNSAQTYLLVLEFIICTPRISFLPQVSHGHITLLEYLPSLISICSLFVTIITDFQSLRDVFLQIMYTVNKIICIDTLLIFQIWKCNQINHTFWKYSINNMKLTLSYSSIHQIIIHKFILG